MGAVFAACALLVSCTGCGKDAAATAHEWALEGLVREHTASVACVDAVLEGDFDADAVPGDAERWQDCFRLGSEGQSASDMIAVGLPIEDGSWLLSETATATGTTLVAIDVAVATVDRGAEGPVQATVARCWTATVPTEEDVLQGDAVIACPAGVVGAVSGHAIEVPASASPTA